MRTQTLVFLALRSRMAPSSAWSEVALGETFGLWDLPAYAVGVGLAVALDTILAATAAADRLTFVRNAPDSPPA